MLIVTGTITATSETFERVREASLAHVRASRLEPGCLSHAVFVDGEDPLRLFFYERWTDRAALMTHFGVAKAGPLLTLVRELRLPATGPEIAETAESEVPGDGRARASGLVRSEH